MVGYGDKLQKAWWEVLANHNPRQQVLLAAMLECRLAAGSRPAERKWAPIPALWAVREPSSHCELCLLLSNSPLHPPRYASGCVVEYKMLVPTLFSEHPPSITRRPAPSYKNFVALICRLGLPDTSVLWHRWLGDRKGMRPVKKLGVGLLVVTIWLELFHVL